MLGPAQGPCGSRLNLPSHPPASAIQVTTPPHHSTCWREGRGSVDGTLTRADGKFTHIVGIKWMGLLMKIYIRDLKGWHHLQKDWRTGSSWFLTETCLAFVGCVGRRQNLCT